MKIEALTAYLQYFRQHLARLRYLHKVASLASAPDKEHCALQHRQLKLLVPMCRSLTSAVQQLENGGEKGDALYRKQFQGFKSALQLAFSRSYRSHDQLVFEGEMLAIELPVPVEGVSVAGWPRQTVAALTESAKREFSEAATQRVAQRLNAQQAKDAFLDGLSAAQFSQLKALVAATKAAGLGPLTFGGSGRGVA